jgi:hypothetical protein
MNIYWVVYESNEPDADEDGVFECRADDCEHAMAQFVIEHPWADALFVTLAGRAR